MLPGLIDAHTHMFNVPRPGMSREAATLIAVHNMQADLRAGFTTARDMSSHGNGYADVDIRNAINEGRLDGPRFQVSGRGIVWASGVEPARQHRACPPWRKRARPCAITTTTASIGSSCFPTGGYSFTATGEAQYELRYPTARAAGADRRGAPPGHKAACHVYGGEGQHNAIIAGCDTIEHAFGLTPDDAKLIVSKGSTTTRLSCATSSPTWTTTTRRPRAASTG